MQQLIRHFLIPLLATTMCVVVFEGLSRASLPGGGEQKPSLLEDTRLSPAHKDYDVNKIINVLESRIKNHNLPEKAKNKLAAMKDEDVQILKSLCDRMSETGDTAIADFALLLAAAVIVIS
ncbi:MAG TPA: hypothetical protein VEM40_01410 [Nitrospirota bacterium]|nr:hypothetical protein [Nitrospirota bacterium]